MPHAVTFPQAATLLGHKSAGILYRLKRQNLLNDYIIPGNKGPALLVLAPAGLPTLADHVDACRSPRAPRAALPAELPVWPMVRIVFCDRLRRAAREASILLQLPPEEAMVLDDLLLETLADLSVFAAEWSA